MKRYFLIIMLILISTYLYSAQTITPTAKPTIQNQEISNTINAQQNDIKKNSIWTEAYDWIKKIIIAAVGAFVGVLGSLFVFLMTTKENKKKDHYSQLKQHITGLLDIKDYRQLQQNYDTIFKDLSIHFKSYYADIIKYMSLNDRLDGLEKSFFDDIQSRYQNIIINRSIRQFLFWGDNKKYEPMVIDRDVRGVFSSTSIQYAEMKRDKMREDENLVKLKQEIDRLKAPETKIEIKTLLKEIDDLKKQLDDNKKNILNSHNLKGDCDFIR